MPLTNERNHARMTTPQIGMIVRDTTLGCKYTGTITSVSTDRKYVHVHWHGTIATEEWPIESLNILS